MDPSERWRDLNMLLTRNGPLVPSGFEPSPELREMLANDIRVLCVGAGGLGCEILKDLALTGFCNIDVIDMDTIDVSNLNRQFLFRMADVGKSKAVVAAERVNARVPGVRVTAHHGRIEEMPPEWYQQFQIIILGLDSLEARRYMNTLVCSFLEYDEDGQPAGGILPMIDGGTEGFKGHARVILPGYTPCFECTLWLFPPQTRFPLCTLAETPRSAAHCIEYAKLILWPNTRQNEEFDADREEHMKWVCERAAERAKSYGISGVTYQHTQGVVKNIIPAIASTNAIISAACVLEALKTVTMCSTGLDNYMMYTANAGVYTHTVKYEKDEACPICSAGTLLEVAPDATLQQVIEAMLAHPTLGKMLATPSVSHGSTQLYMRGVFEEHTRGNLGKPIAELVDGAAAPVILSVNDKKLPAPLRVRLKLAAAGSPDGMQS